MRSPRSVKSAATDAVSPDPLTDSDFAAAMAAFHLPSLSSIAIGVSGGPDSMALALCTGDWVKTRGISVTAFIVDHGLRAESGAEAEHTQQQLAMLGIKAEILRWTHPPILSRLHITARKARYQLLADACRAHGIHYLMLAHHREDQAETILMRLSKGSGIDGLSGMKSQTQKDGIILLRPFLFFPKARLIATCAASDTAFITDPSNASEKFARGRLRRVLPLLSEEGLSIDRLLNLGARASEAKDALDHYTFTFLRDHTNCDCAGTLRFDLNALKQTPRAIVLRALAAGLHFIHPQAYAPEHASLTRLADALIAPDEMQAATLHGGLISKSAAQVTIMREASLLTESLPIRPGQTVTWDQRWSVTLSAACNPLEYFVRPLGNPPHEMIDTLAPDLRRTVPQGRARAGLPAIWAGDELVFIPSLTDKAQPVFAKNLSTWPPNLSISSIFS